MQRGFEGNKTQLIENEKQNFINRTECVTVDMLIKQCGLVKKLEKQDDNYNASRAYAILDAMCEISAKKGVK